MGDLTICTQSSWLDHFLQQKLSLFSLMSSSTCSQARLCSGDGFSVSLPAHLLLASSKMARDTFLPELAGQDVLLPSVRGSTLLLLVEILRSGRTSNLGSTDSMGHRLKEVQEAMMLLDITGSMALMRDDSSVSEFKTQLRNSSYKERSENDFSPLSLLLEKEELPRYLNPVVEVTKLKVVDHDGLIPVVDCAKIKDEDEEFSGRDMSASENGLMDQVVKKVLQQECHVCHKKCKNRASLKEHLRQVHKDSRFSCKQCDSKFFLEDSLKRHVVYTHHGIRLNCEYCQGTYRNKESLRNHMGKAHKNELFSCKDCDMNFISEIALRHHVESRHSGIQFQCDVCPAKFSKKDRVRIHMKTVHSGILFGCDQCGSTFHSKPNLKRHIVNVHTRLDIGDKSAEQLDQDVNVNVEQVPDMERETSV